MSVYREDYIILGTNIINKIKNNEDEYFDKLESDFKNNSELKFIYDNMAGRYCYVGKVLLNEVVEVKLFVFSHYR